MDLRTVIFGHVLVISLALNAGFLYRDYCSGKTKFQQYFSFKYESKNGSLLTNKESHVAKRTFIEAPLPPSSSSMAVDEVLDLDHRSGAIPGQRFPLLIQRDWDKS